MDAALKARLDSFLAYPFPTKSSEGTALNDILDAIESVDGRVESLAYIIENRGFLEPRNDFIPSKREMGNDRWREIVRANGIIFRAIVETAFRELPQATVVARRFLEALSRYTDEWERDVLVGVLMTDERIPYPNVPPASALPTLSDEDKSKIWREQIREVRMVDFMYRDSSFTDYTSVAAVIVSQMESYDEFKQKQSYLSACLSRLQMYITEAVKSDGE